MWFSFTHVSPLMFVGHHILMVLIRIFNQKKSLQFVYKTLDMLVSLYLCSVTGLLHKKWWCTVGFLRM